MKHQGRLDSFAFLIMCVLIVWLAVLTLSMSHRLIEVNDRLTGEVRVNEMDIQDNLDLIHGILEYLNREKDKRNEQRERGEDSPPPRPADPGPVHTTPQATAVMATAQSGPVARLPREHRAEGHTVPCWHAVAGTRPNKPWCEALPSPRFWCIALEQPRLEAVF